MTDSLTPSYAVVDVEGRLPVEDGDGDGAVEEEALHEHPVDARHGGVVLQDEHRLAQPVLQQQQKQQ